MSGRRVHSGSGRTYHVVFNPPKVEGKHDVTGKIWDPCRRRRDHSASVWMSTISRPRPLIGFYGKEAEAGNTRYVKIDGTQPVDLVSQQLAAILGCHSGPAGRSRSPAGYE